MSTIDLSKYKQIADEFNKGKQLTKEEIQQLSAQSANEVIKNFKSYLNSNKDSLKERIEKSLTDIAKEGYYNLKLSFNYKDEEEDFDWTSWLTIKDNSNHRILLSFMFKDQLVYNGCVIDEFIDLNDLKDILVLCYRSIKEILSEFGLDPIYDNNDEDLIYTKQDLQDTEVGFVIQFK